MLPWNQLSYKSVGFPRFYLLLLKRKTFILNRMIGQKLQFKQFHEHSFDMWVLKWSKKCNNKDLAESFDWYVWSSSWIFNQKLQWRKKELLWGRM